VLDEICQTRDAQIPLSDLFFTTLSLQILFRIHVHFRYISGTQETPEWGLVWRGLNSARKQGPNRANRDHQKWSASIFVDSHSRSPLQRINQRLTGRPHRDCTSSVFVSSSWLSNSLHATAVELASKQASKSRMHQHTHASKQASKQARKQVDTYP
jgi:hypothetical protein